MFQFQFSSEEDGWSIVCVSSGQGGGCIAASRGSHRRLELLPRGLLDNPMQCATDF